MKYTKQIYTVYMEKSFAQAADTLHISQAALKYIIKRAEKEICLELFDRNCIPIKLTPAGEQYIQAIEKIMTVEKELEASLKALLQDGNDIVTIGSSTFFCAHVLPGIIQNFYRQYPGRKLELLEGNVSDLAQCLNGGAIDLCLDSSSLDTAAFETRLWKQEEVILAVPAHFSINTRLQDCRLSFHDVSSKTFSQTNWPAVDLRHFTEEPFLLLKKGNDMYSRAISMCEAAGFAPRSVMYLDQLLTSYYVACGGKGIAFMRAEITRYVEQTDKLYFYKINHPKALRDILVYYKKSTPLPKTARDFIQFLLGNS